MVSGLEGWAGSADCIRNLGWVLEKDGDGEKVFVNGGFRMVAADVGGGAWTLGIYSGRDVLMDFGANDFEWTQDLVCTYGILWGLSDKD